VPVVAAQDPKSGRTIYVERISPSLAAEEFTRASLAKEGGRYRDELSLANVETSQALMAGGAFTALRKPAGTPESLTRKAASPRAQASSLVDGEMAGFDARRVIPASNEEILALGKGPLAQYAATEEILVLGRGPLSRLDRLADSEGGRISTVDSLDPREIFRKNYGDIRKADTIIQYMDNIPTTLEEALRIGGGQFSRAEVFMINQRLDLLQKTFRKFENPPTK
jgi:hypothetical protein